MAKIDWMKYVIYGASAALVPILGNQFLGEMLANVPFWGQDLWSGLTLGGIVLAGAGVLIADQFFYKK